MSVAIRNNSQTLRDDDSTLIVTSGNDDTYGYVWNELLPGIDGSDWMIAGWGDDMLRSGVGATDMVDGGYGVDHSLIAGIDHSVISGDDNDNILNGTDDGDLMHAYGGNDRLSGRGGNDSLSGGYGDDIMAGGDGADVLRGEAGIDTAEYLDSWTGVFAGQWPSAPEEPMRESRPCARELFTLERREYGASRPETRKRKSYKQALDVSRPAES